MYCSLDDIKTEFANSINLDSNPKLPATDIDNLIVSESNYIDSNIASKYLTPIDKNNSPLAYELLKRICVYLDADRIRNILNIKTGVQTLDQDVKAPNRTPKDDLFSIVDGKLRLIDGIIATDDDGVAFGFQETEYKPFELNKQQW